MPTIKTKDGTEIYYKDWGSGQPVVFSHGWPLSADDWDTQMLFFLNHGYRVIAHDRRGHGRSSQTGDGHDMDHYADDLAALTAQLDLKNAIHVGHTTGGGEVVHYLGRHGESRVAKAAIISAVPPLMLKTAANPGGLPKEVFDGLQAQLAANRSQFYRALPEGPFYGYNRPGAKASEGIIQNWWRQGMMGGAKAHYDGIVAFSQTDFTEDLKKITVPVLVMHSDDDQIVPYADSGPLSAKLLKNGTLKTYKGFPHGMPTTEAATINADLLAFGRSPTGQRHAKLREIVHGNFLDYSAIESQLAGFDACFFCLGVSSVGMGEERYRHLTYDITLATATTLARLNPGMVFTYVSGAGTDSTEQGRVMWARVKGKTENDLLKLPFKAAYMFRPAGIQPLHGVRSKTAWVQAIYVAAAPLLSYLTRVAPKYMTTTQQVGRAMIKVARDGYPKPVLESEDINRL